MINILVTTCFPLNLVKENKIYVMSLNKKAKLSLGIELSIYLIFIDFCLVIILFHYIIMTKYDGRTI